MYSFFAQTKSDAYKMYRAGNYVGAIKVCEDELKQNAKNMDSYVVLCWSLVNNRQFAEAELHATNARKISQYDHRIIEILAEAKFYLGKNVEALNLFQEYISLVSSNGDRLGLAYYFIGEIYVLQAMYEHADIALSQAVLLEPLKEAWWIRLGYAREMTKKYDKAVIAYDKALDLNNGAEDARRGKERVMPLIR
ncbi:MAG: tetratricopeptide repeat protein [Treponema sp.]|nr:tetratricopeptide repeat protein [Treponema sp.]